MLSDLFLRLLRRPVTDWFLWRGLWIGFAATTVVEVALFIAGASLVTDAAPRGIISFELALTPERTQAILSSWDNAARLDAALGLGLDYLYIATYAATLVMACLWVSRRFARWSRLGGALACGALAAGLLDAVENVALYLELRGAEQTVLAPLAFTCAAIKFALVIPAIGYTLAGLLVALFVKLKKKWTRSAYPKAATGSNGAISSRRPAG